MPYNALVAEAYLSGILSNWLTELAMFPAVLFDNAGDFCVALVVVVLLYALTAKQRPDYPDKIPSVSRLAARAEGGVEGIIGVGAALYATWQYTVHGEQWIEATKFLLIFAFFGQLYATATRWQAVRHLSVVTTAFGVLKTVLSIASISSVIAVLDKSAAYRRAFPDEIRMMNFPDFVHFFVASSFNGYGEWCEFVLQQGMGVLTRLAVVVVGLGAVAYHVSVRYSGFRSGYRWMFWRLARMDGLPSTVMVFVFSFLSDEMMKGKLFADLPIFMRYIGDKLFNV